MLDDWQMFKKVTSCSTVSLDEKASIISIIQHNCPSTHPLITEPTSEERIDVRARIIASFNLGQVRDISHALLESCRGTRMNR